ncbi:MAG: hypothetical protein WCO96_03790 [Actinomycetes bacterium]
MTTVEKASRPEAERSDGLEPTAPTSGKLAPLRSASAFSWPVLALYCPAGLAIQVSGNQSNFGGSSVAWVAAGAIAMVVLCAILVGSRRLICRGNRVPGVGSVLLAYSVATLAQSLTLGLLSTLNGASDEIHLAFRLSGPLLQVPLLTAIAYLVCRHDAHRRKVAELERSRARLLAIDQSLEVALDRLESELSGAVRSSLEPALRELDVALTEASRHGEAQPALEALASLLEDRIRPLSHELAGDQPASDPAAEQAVPPRTRVPLPKRFHLADGFRPTLVALVLAVAAIPTAIRDLAPLHSLLYLSAFCGGTFVVLALVRKVLGTAEARSGPGVVAVVALHGVAGRIAFALVGAAGIQRPEGIALAASMVVALIGAAVVGDMLVSARRAATEADLATVTGRLEQAVTLMRRRQRLVTRRLAFVLHGSLQGSLHAAAIRIRQADDLTARLANELRGDITAALTQMDQRRPMGESSRTRTTLDEIASVWEGVRTVTARLDPRTEALLEVNDDTDEAVSVVVQEAVNNAFRHGSASSVRIELTATDEQSIAPGREISVVIEDDGSATGVDRRPGLGSALLDELCDSWTRERDGGTMTLRAQVALG